MAAARRAYAVEIGDDLLLFDPARGSRPPARARDRRPGAGPFGIHAYAGREDNDLVPWLPAIGAIVTGDTFSDFGRGLEISSAAAHT